MSIYDSKLWISDLDEIVETLPELRELVNKSILITGCTGLICSAIIDVFIRWNESHDEKIIILAAGRDKKRVIERFFPYNRETWFTYIPYDASSVRNTFDFSCNYIIHGASNASPNKILKEPVETMLSNFNGMKGLLDYAKETGVKRILYISSSEVYGKKEGNEPYKINEYGFVDLLNPRNSYAIGKRATESLCASYASEYGVESVIIRPGHIYGPTALKSDNRVASAWAYLAAHGKDIIMKSDGSQLRSYCYCLDSSSAIIKVLLRGNKIHAYNISDPNSIISIRQMAELLARFGGVKLKVNLPSVAEQKGFNPMNNSSLDSTELLSLGWKSIFNVERGFSHTVKILKELGSLKAKAFH